MRLRKILILLIFIFLNIKCFSQNIEIRLDSSFQDTVSHIDTKFIIKEHTIYSSGQPFLKLRELIRSEYLDEVKQTVFISEYDLKYLTNEIFAAVNKRYKPTQPITLETYKTISEIDVRFYTNNQEHLIYKNRKRQPDNAVLINFLRDLKKFDIVKENQVSRPELKKLFLHYNQDVTNKACYAPGPECGFGLPETVRYFDFTKNLLKVSGRLNLDCRFSIESMQNESTIQRINFYNLRNEFIGSAIFIPDEDEVQDEMYGYPILTYKFIPKNGKMKIFKIYDRQGFSNFNNPFNEIYGNYETQNHFIYTLNPNSTESNFHPKVMGQIVEISREIANLYHF